MPKYCEFPIGQKVVGSIMKEKSVQISFQSIQFLQMIQEEAMIKPTIPAFQSYPIL